jgi:acetylornithine/N-succinyldiaminopimelate aminotransferase
VTRAVSTVFDILKEEKIVENAAEVSKYLVAQFDELVKDFKCVESHRGIGLMQGLVLNVPAAKVDQALIKEGLIVVTAGPQVLRFLPPLIITKEHVDAAMTIIRKVLKEFEA